MIKKIESSLCDLFKPYYSIEKSASEEYFIKFEDIESLKKFALTEFGIKLKLELEDTIKY